jgi:hypothetical protein
MDASDLTTDQAKQLFNRIQPQLRYLHALRGQMEKRGFPPDDKLRQLVERAHASVHSLYIELHYMSCASGVWRER